MVQANSHLAKLTATGLPILLLSGPVVAQQSGPSPILELPLTAAPPGAPPSPVLR